MLERFKQWFQNPIVVFTTVFLSGVLVIGVGCWFFLPWPRTQEASRKDRFTDALNTMRVHHADLTVRMKELVRAAVAANEKEKLKPQERFVARESLDLYKEELRLSATRLDKLEQEARAEIRNEEDLKEVIGDIQKARNAITHCEEAEKVLRGVLEKSFDKTSTPLERALENAYKEVEKALKELNDPEKPKP